MVCPKCGASLNDGDVFCSVCGFQLDGAAQPPATVQTLPAVIPGSKMLKVCSILFIVFAGLSIVVSLIIVAAAGGYINAVGIIFLIVVDGGAIAIGIVGLRKYKDPAAGLFFIIAGSIFIPLQILFVGLLANGSIGLGGLVLGILFIVGGAKLRKAGQPTA